jgi:hypothetical protein
LQDLVSKVIKCRINHMLEIHRAAEWCISFWSRVSFHGLGMAYCIATACLSIYFRNYSFCCTTVTKFKILFIQDRQCTYKRNIQARSRNHFCLRKAMSITYTECVSVALVIRHAKRKRHIILSYLACLALPCFFTLSHKRHDFREKGIEHKLCDFSYSTNFI